jgi:hypothetical protein
MESATYSPSTGPKELARLGKKPALGEAKLLGRQRLEDQKEFQAAKTTSRFASTEATAATPLKTALHSGPGN